MSNQKLVFMSVLILLLTSFIFSNNVSAAETYHSGKIYDYTSVTGGLLIRFEGNVVPTACPQNNVGWMIVPEESKTIISVALMLIAQGKTGVTVYTSGVVGGFCKITQLDPHAL